MSHSQVALDWAQRVIAGEEDRCSYVRLACERFVRDLGRTDWLYAFDAEEADRRCRWIERLPHVKGAWAARRERLKLEPWQAFIVANLFGWRHRETGKRRFRELYLEVPRKNTKSTLAAAIGLALFADDAEFGAEIYSGATSEKQAWEVFRPARQMAERTDALRDAYDIEVNAKSLTILSTGNRFEPIIGNPGDGASPHCYIADEFHEHATSDQIDTMQTGMGAREQPLTLIITTAGTDFGGPCREKRGDAVRILERSVEDETVFGIVFTLDDGDAWDTEASLRKANPNFGVSVYGDYLLAELAKARRSPTKQAAYKTKHLNLWVGARAAWMNLLAFQRCRKKGLALEDFRGERCFVGLDLASRVDVASMAIVFPPSETRAEWAAFFRRWVPETTVQEVGSRYTAFHAGGWLEATPGDVIDFDVIEEELEGLKSRHEVVEVPYDPFQATQFSVHMLERGFPMVEFGATVKNFSEPMKELEALILQREIEFQLEDTVLLWMMGNVTARMDKKDNIFPTKERPENKIDDVVALIMAVARVLAHQGDRYVEGELVAL